MPTITITINTDNDAFEYASELTSILQQAEDKINNYDERYNVLMLIDSNGNSCGTLEITR